MTDLRSRIIRSSFWVTVGQAAGQVLRLASNLVMTRLLVPDAFGVMAIANIVMVGLHLLSDAGLKQVLIQNKRGHEIAFQNAVWTLQVLRGVGVWIAALGVALAIYFLAQYGCWKDGSVYASPVLPPVIGVLAFTALIDGFKSTRLITANRELRLGSVIVVELASQIGGLALMIAWASLDPTIWSLVAGGVLAGLLRVVLSHTVVLGEVNRFHWDREIASEIFRFGKWILLSSTLGFLAANGDRIIIGGFVEVAVLGLYSIAFLIFNTVRLLLTQIMQRVCFPALSEVVRERPQDLKLVYYRLRLPLDAVTLLAMGALYYSGGVIIEILYDPRYSQAGFMLSVLSLNIFVLRFQLVDQSLLALGMPKHLLLIIAPRVFGVFVLLPFAFSYFGFTGALWVAGTSSLLSLPFYVWLKMKHGLMDLWYEVRIIGLIPIGVGIGWVITELYSMARSLS